jgi:two-component system phosphate regulon response regulator PhoB
VPTRGGGRHLLGPLEVDRDRYHVFVRGKEIFLTPLEMRLLSDLMEHQGRVRTREDLLKTVWRYRAGVTTRTTDTHVRRLRKKLGPAKILLETIRGRGYRLSVEPAPDDG